MRAARRDGLPAFIPTLMLAEWSWNDAAGVAAKWFISEGNARRRMKRITGPIMYRFFGPGPWSSAQYQHLKASIIRDSYVVDDLV